MKHLAKVTVARDLKPTANSSPEFADAKTDFQNAIWRAWSDYVYQKKNEVALQ